MNSWTVIIDTAHIEKNNSIRDFLNLITLKSEFHLTDLPFNSLRDPSIKTTHFYSFFQELRTHSEEKSKKYLLAIFPVLFQWAGVDIPRYWNERRTTKKNIQNLTGKKKFWLIYVKYHLKKQQIVKIVAHDGTGKVKTKQIGCGRRAQHRYLKSSR